jgi:type I restriction enzyme, S subunit
MIKEVRICEIATITSGSTPSRKRSEYWNGTIPWVKTGNLVRTIIIDSDIDERITREALAKSAMKILPAGTIIMAMYGQGKTRGHVSILGVDAAINQACAAFLLKDRILRDFLFQQLKYRYHEIRNLSNTGSQKNLTAGIIRGLKIPLPSKQQQAFIADTLQQWDFAIEKTERLIELKNYSYSHLLSTIYAPQKAKRFIKINELASEVSLRNRGANNRVLSVTNHSGFVLPEEQFAKRVASEDLANYKVVLKGQYAYNPSRINVGSIARLESWEIGVLSPMYTVFELDSQKVHTDYFFHWLSSSYANRAICQCAQGSVRETVGFFDFAAIELPLIGLSEQAKVTHFLNGVRREIEIHTAVSAQYRKQKSFLMSKLLTGEWDAPELGAKGK